MREGQTSQRAQLYIKAGSLGKGLNQNFQVNLVCETLI